MLGTFMGLRNFEVCKLNVEDVSCADGTLFLHEGKGAKDAVLPIPKFLIGPLRGWIGKRRTGPLFASRKGGRHLTPRALRQAGQRTAAAAQLADAAKPRRYYFHLLRHYFCTDRIRRGVPLPYVQRLMRHAHIQTTMRYTHIVPEDLRAGMDA